MRNALYVLAACVVSGAAMGQPTEPLGGELCAQARQRFYQSVDPSERGQAAAPRGAGSTDVLHYDLDLEVFPSTENIAGACDITLLSTGDGLTTLPLRLREQFNITSVTVNGVPVNWNRVDTVFFDVTLDRAYNTGEQLVVRVEYNGQALARGFGSINFVTHGNGQDLIFSLSETEFAYTWWPNKDDNADKATADLRYTVPSGLSVASNGVLQSVTSPAPGKSTYHWRTDYQTATYLICFSAANYNMFTETFNHAQGSTPVEFMVFPEDDSPGYRAQAAEMVPKLEVFSDLFGLYPFADEKYGVYQFGFGGGMEHQTMTGQSTVANSLDAHELAHQWWGDMVTAQTWNHIWLNESFATYSEALWEEHRPGSSGAPALHAAMDARRPSAVGDSVYVVDGTLGNLNRIFSYDFSYLKGAWVLHMLRNVIGDDDFFQTLAAYRQGYQYASATTEDFQGVAESISGMDLGWFFSEWIYDVGAPAYRYAWTTHTVGARHFVEVYIRQVQNSAYPDFKMPIDCEATVGGSPDTYRIWNDADGEHLLFETPGVATAFQFDPDDRILATSVATTTFVQGPPKIIDTLPVEGEMLPASAVATIDVTFHKPVSASGADVTLVGANTGAVAFSAAYDAPAQRLRITPDEPLAADDYTLTIADSVSAGGIALDGEVPGAGGGALPSGDGLPGGDAQFHFTITNSADLNGDGVVDTADLGILLSVFGTNDAGSDLNGDGVVDTADLGLLLAAFGS
ncbi:MAG: Ig-like domain-containing protein [Phycisphaeraceae bacterium]|nr:Ig-like domain-containing protein [Phycisphaeraceae bacterium]